MRATRATCEHCGRPLRKSLALYLHETLPGNERVWDSTAEVYGGWYWHCASPFGPFADREDLVGKCGRPQR
jgi:hypothetical protein